MIQLIIGRGWMYKNTNIKIETSPILSVKWILDTGNFTTETNKNFLEILGEIHLFNCQKK